MSEERDVPTPCRLLRLGVSRRGPSGLFCQTQGATERELPDREGKVGRAENRPEREKLEGQRGYTQTHRGSRSSLASPQRCVDLSRCPSARPLRRRRESLRAEGPGRARPGRPEGSPPPAGRPVQRRAPRVRPGRGRDPAGLYRHSRGCLQPHVPRKVGNRRLECLRKLECSRRLQWAALEGSRSVI